MRELVAQCLLPKSVTQEVHTLLRAMGLVGVIRVVVAPTNAFPADKAATCGCGHVLTTVPVVFINLLSGPD